MTECRKWEKKEETRIYLVSGLGNQIDGDRFIDIENVLGGKSLLDGDNEFN